MNKNCPVSAYRKLKWVAVLVLIEKMIWFGRLVFISLNGCTANNVPSLSITVFNLTVLVFFAAWLYSMLSRLRISVMLTNFVILVPVVFVLFIGLESALNIIVLAYNKLPINPSYIGVAFCSPAFLWLYSKYVLWWWIKQKSSVQNALQ